MEPVTINQKALLLDGWMKCGVLIEIVGKPKEHVEGAMADYMKKIREEKEFHILDEHIAETKKRETGVEEDDMLKEMWATFVELEFLIKEPIQLTHFCLNYMPSSVEIIEPEELKWSSQDSTKFFNDLQSRLHQLDMVAKNVKSEVFFLRKSVNGLLNNFLTLLLRKQELTVRQLSNLTGVGIKTLEDFLDTLIDKKMVEMDGELYKFIGGKNEPTKT